MSDLYVDLTALERTAQRLGRVEEELQACAQALRHASASDLGSARLDDACADFRDSWSYGTEKLGQAASVVRQQLEEGLRVYVEADEALAGVVRR